jgi:DNA-binding NarL/FixJ family response regulator
MTTIFKGEPRTTRSSSGKHRVLVVDDHPVVRSGLTKLINDQPKLCVCGEAGSIATAVRAAARTRPDLIILDLTLEGNDGLEVCRQIRETAPHVPVLVLSMHDEELYAERAIRAGAMGYVMKQAPADQLLEAIRTVLAKRIYLSEKMASRCLRSVVEGRVRGGSDQLDPLERLTDRELQVFTMIAEGRTVRAIADALCLSPKTVEAHKDNMKQKLGISTSNELLRVAIETRVHRPL